MRTRNQINKEIDKKLDKIKSLKSEISKLKKEDLLLCDKYQRFEEKEEDVLVCGRPKKYEKKLIGKIYWKEDFVDEDTGKVVTIERSQIVRVNGEWTSFA